MCAVACPPFTDRSPIQAMELIGHLGKQCNISVDEYSEFLRNISAQKTFSMRNVSTISSSNFDSPNTMWASEPNLSSELPSVSRPVTVRPPRKVNFIESFTLKSLDTPDMPDVSPSATATESWISGILSFKKTQVMRNIEYSLDQARSTQNYYLREGDTLEAAVMSVFAIRHRVLLMEDGLHNALEKNNAVQSFPKDVAGKWDQPEGDLLLFPGLHQDVSVLQGALVQLSNAMQIVKMLPGRLLSNQVERVFRDSNSITFHSQTAEIKCKVISENMKYLNLIYKPIFSKIYFKMKSSKARLAVEMFQSASLVFMKLADWAFAYQEYGAALFFTQLMHKSVESLVELLPIDKDLQRSYIFVMCHYFVARCYHSVYVNFNNFEEYRPSYEKLFKIMEDFGHNFFIHIEKRLHPFNKFPYDLPVEFPTSVVTSLTTSSLAFMAVSFPSTWGRSRYEQETIFTHFLLLSYYNRTADMMSSVEPSIESKIVTLEEIAESLDVLANKTSVHRNFKIFAYSLGAKNARFLLCMDESHQIELRDPKKFYMANHFPDERTLNHRFSAQISALSLMSEEFRSTSHQFHLILLCKMATRTMDDEVIYSLNRHNNETFSASTLQRLLIVLPEVVNIWFCQDGRRDPQTGKIPSEDMKYFNHITAMFFFGLTISCRNMYSITWSSEQKENQRYFFAVSASLFRREGASEGVLAAIIDHVHLLEKSFLGIYVPPVRHRDARVRVLLQRLTWALPVLHEQLIKLDIGEALPFGYRKLIIKGHRLFPKEKIGNIMEYIENEIGFDHSQDFEILEGKGKLGELKCTALRLNQSAFVNQNEFDAISNRIPDYENRPPIGQNKSIEHGYPIESYYDDEEVTFTKPIISPYDEWVYTVILNDSPGRHANVNQLDKAIEMNEVLKVFEETLLRLLEAEIIALKDLVNKAMISQQFAADSNILGSAPDDNGNCGNEDISFANQSPSNMLSSFKVMFFDLKNDLKNELTVLALTKVLSKLDTMLNQEGFSKLLRSNIEP